MVARWTHSRVDVIINPELVKETSINDDINCKWVLIYKDIYEIYVADSIDNLAQNGSIHRVCGHVWPLLLMLGVSDIRDVHGYRTELPNLTTTDGLLEPESFQNALRIIQFIEITTKIKQSINPLPWRKK